MGSYSENLRVEKVMKRTVGGGILELKDTDKGRVGKQREPVAELRGRQWMRTDKGRVGGRETGREGGRETGREGGRETGREIGREVHR
jgi:hypothetical protein